MLHLFYYWCINVWENSGNLSDLSKQCVHYKMRFVSSTVTWAVLLNVFWWYFLAKIQSGDGGGKLLDCMLHACFHSI